MELLGTLTIAEVNLMLGCNVLVIREGRETGRVKLRGIIPAFPGWIG
jgi:hypothetical protein